MEHIYFNLRYIISINIFMNCYKLFKYFPDNLGCKSCLSYHNLVTFIKYSYNYYNMSNANNLNIIYLWNNDTQYYCKPYDK